MLSLEQSNHNNKGEETMHLYPSFHLCFLSYKQSWVIESAQKWRGLLVIPALLPPLLHPHVLALRFQPTRNNQTNPSPNAVERPPTSLLRNAKTQVEEAQSTEGSPGTHWFIDNALFLTFVVGISFACVKLVTFLLIWIIIHRHRWTGRYEAHLWDKTSWNDIQKKKGRQGDYD